MGYLKTKYIFHKGIKYEEQDIVSLTATLR